MAASAYEMRLNIYPFDESGIAMATYMIPQTIRDAAYPKHDIRLSENHLTDSRSIAKKPVENWALKRSLHEMPQIYGVINWVKSGQQQTEPISFLSLHVIVSTIESIPKYLGYRYKDPIRNVPNPIMDAARIAGGIALATHDLAKMNPDAIATGQAVYDHANDIKKGGTYLDGPTTACPAPASLIIGLTNEIISGSYGQTPQQPTILEGINIDDVTKTALCLEKTNNYLQLAIRGRPTKNQLKQLATEYTSTSVELAQVLGYPNKDIDKNKLRSEFLNLVRSTSIV